MARLGRSWPFLPKFKRPDLGVVYFDNTSVSAYSTSVLSFNWNHTIGGNNDRALFVGVGIFGAGSVSSISYGAQSLSFIRSDTNGIYTSEIWRLVAPSTGTATITVNLSASLTAIGGAASYWGVDQINPISANNGANGTNNPASASITPGTDNNRILGNLSAQTASGVTEQIGQAFHYVNSGALGTIFGSEEGSVISPASTTLQWNGMGALDSWAVSLIAIQPVQAVASATKIFLTLLGCGT